MKQEDFEKHKPFAGEAKPSMLRRRVGHDYQGRCIYLITITVEGRRPLLGRLTGDADAPEGSPEAPRVELSPLGEAVRSCWQDIGTHYPAIRVMATMVMPDHLHGILFVQEHMEQHLSMAIKGFKVGCNKAYRRLAADAGPAMLQPWGDAGPAMLQPRADAGPAMLQQCCSTGGQRASTGGQRASTGGQPRPAHLWARNFNDHILGGAGELQRWFDYLRDNPRRLAIRQKHPEYFRVRFGITIGTQTYAAIGNRFLLSYPWKLPVQCTRRLTDEEVAATVEQYLTTARKGAVLVSPAISKGEQAVMRAVLNARKPLIFLSPWGFNDYSRPGHQFYEACAEGRFLILAPWPHENRRLPLTRAMCLSLNAMTKDICGQ